MADHDEMLEDEPQTCATKLVGAGRLAPWRSRRLAVEAAKDERPELYVAAAAFQQRAAGVADGDDGENLSRETASGQDPKGVALLDQAAALEISARGQRRPTGWLVAPASDRPGIASTLLRRWRMTVSRLCNCLMLMSRDRKGAV